MGIITATVQVETTTAGVTKKESKTFEIGQLAVATFQNPNGLTKAGGNYYTTNENDNAGQVAAGKPGDGGTATLMTGYIEASNVDLAKEFADMITTHRGFQANSKMITVSDEMLQDLVSMKR
jgi:flagellar hook protein FlgE